MAGGRALFDFLMVLSLIAGVDPLQQGLVLFFVFLGGVESYRSLGGLLQVCYGACWSVS